MQVRDGSVASYDKVGDVSIWHGERVAYLCNQLTQFSCQLEVQC